MRLLSCGRGFGRLAMLLLPMALLLISAAANSVSGYNGISNAPTQNDATSCRSAAFALYDATNQSVAISNALSSQDYQNATAEYGKVTYESIFQVAKTEVPYPYCTEKVLSYNVVFTLFNNAGDWAGKLVVVENRTLAVTGYLFQTVFGSATTSGKWSGYEVQTSSSNPATIYVSSSYFTQATPYYPSGGCSDSGECAMATWVGLTDTSLASSGNLVQDGTWAVCVNSGCKPTYFAWYEMLPGSSFTQCSGVSIGGGDTIYSSVYNEAQNPGGSNTKYDIYVDDTTSSTSCSTTLTDTLMTAPSYGDFIHENPKWCSTGPSCTCFVYPSAGNGCDSLPGFTTGTSTEVDFSTAFIEGGSTYGYINSFSPNSITMQNQPSNGNYGQCTGSLTTNAYPGSISGNGDFAVDYSSSDYTPWWNTGC